MLTDFCWCGAPWDGDQLCTQNAAHTLGQNFVKQREFDGEVLECHECGATAPADSWLLCPHCTLCVRVPEGYELYRVEENGLTLILRKTGT